MLLSHLIMPALVGGLFMSAVSEMLIYEERWLFNTYVIARLLLSLPHFHWRQDKGTLSLSPHLTSISSFEGQQDQTFLDYSWLISMKTQLLVKCNKPRLWEKTLEYVIQFSVCQQKTFEIQFYIIFYVTAIHSNLLSSTGSSE